MLEKKEERKASVLKMTLQYYKAPKLEDSSTKLEVPKNFLAN